MMTGRQKLKIALFVHCFFPKHYHGTETYTLSLARNLKSLGHEVVVVTGVAQDEEQTEALITRYEYLGTSVYCIDKNYRPARHFRDSYYQDNMFEVHKNLLLELKPDIVHVTHLVNHTAALLEAAKTSGIPVVVTLTDFFGICLNSKLKAVDDSLCPGPNIQRTNCFACYLKGGALQAKARLPEQMISKYATVVQTCCDGFNRIRKFPIIRRLRLSGHLENIKERPSLLAHQYGVCRALIAPTKFLKSAYERNGFSTLPMHSLSFGVDIDRMPKQIRVSSVPIKFGFIGQIAPHKGTDILVEAFCRLPVGRSELHIYGAEGQFREYSQSIRRRCSKYEVHFRGTFPTAKMRSVLDEIDFLVIPSTWYENSPLVLLDSLASHTPVIVSDVEGLTEFVRHDQNGFVFARGSVDELEGIMRNIVENPEHSRQLALTTDYAKTVLTMTQEVENIYKSVISPD